MKDWSRDKVGQDDDYDDDDYDQDMGQEGKRGASLAERERNLIAIQMVSLAPLPSSHRL